MAEPARGYDGPGLIATSIAEADSDPLRGGRDARPVERGRTRVRPCKPRCLAMITTTTPSGQTIGGSVLANLSVAELYERAVCDGEGVIAAEGPLVVRTGKHTGRSAKDKF